MNPALIVTVDTEEEGLWNDEYRTHGNTVENTRGIARFQSLCDRFGVTPTYLIDTPVVEDDRSVEMLRSLQDDGRCEIGAHLHPWCAPPFQEEVGSRNSFMNNLPVPLQRNKIAQLTERIEVRFGRRPVSFRAGRCGMSIAAARIVNELGYRVDSSVLPFYDNSNDGGPDFSRAPWTPYWVDGPGLCDPGLSGGLLEIPISVGYSRGDFRRAQRVRELVMNSPLRLLRAVGILDRLGIVQRIKFSPETSNAATMSRLIDVYLAKGAPCLVMILHSSSTVVGHSPYARDARRLEQLYADLEATFRYARERGLCSRTLERFARDFTAEIDPEGSPTMSKLSASEAQQYIVGYDLALEEEIFRFQRAAYPGRREDWIAPRWRWMFVASARRMGVDPMVWLYRNGTAIEGHHAAIPVELKVGNEELFTAWSVETMVLESMRGKGLGPILVGMAQKALPVSLSLGQTPQMRALQLRDGWHQVTPLGTYVYVLDARRLLSGKLGGSLPRHVAALALGAFQRLKHRLGRRRPSWQPSAVEIERFDERHDRLWEKVRSEYVCAVVRNSSYLNWKYVEQPGQQYLRLEIRRGDEVVAVAVLLIVEPAGDYLYRRALLVDLLVLPSDEASVWATLDEVRRASERREAALIVFHLSNEKLARLAVKFGFTARAAERFLLISTDGAAEGVRRQMLEPGSWLVTLGDSDIDRPW